MIQRPLAVTCGDPSGIGLEVFFAAHKRIGNDIPMVLFADRKHLPNNINVTPWYPNVTKDFGSSVVLYQIDFVNSAVPGKSDPQNAVGVIQAIESAVSSALKGNVAGLCTAPINKENLKVGGNFKFPGHTEFLAHLCGVETVVMMLTSSTLSAVPLTVHIPISDVPQAITRALFHKTAHIIHNGLQKDFGIQNPRISVAGLNPHASEGGNIGRDDIDKIAPWIAELQTQGLSIPGPTSADTMFHDVARLRYDVALCMYHDQALIPIKTLDFHNGVNVTLGLDFIRTSPDHGTGFDIAGKNIANPESLISAINLAYLMSVNKDNV